MFSRDYAHTAGLRRRRPDAAIAIVFTKSMRRSPILISFPERILDQAETAVGEERSRAA